MFEIETLELGEKLRSWWGKPRQTKGQLIDKHIKSVASPHLRNIIVFVDLCYFLFDLELHSINFFKNRDITST